MKIRVRVCAIVLLNYLFHTKKSIRMRIVVHSKPAA